MDWLDLLAVQGTLKSLLQHHSSKASILWHSAFFIVQLPYPYMTTEKTVSLTRQTFVGKVMSLLLNMLSRLVIAFLPRSKTSYQLLSLKIGDILSWITYSIYELYVHELHVQLKLIFPLTFDENTVIFQNANSDLIKAYF